MTSTEISAPDSKQISLSSALLQLEIDKEAALIRMLQSSIGEWSKTCGEIEKQLKEPDSDDVDSDWKIKTFHQKDTNEYISRKIEMLSQKCNEHKLKLKKPYVSSENDSTDWKRVVMDLNRKVTNLKSDLKHLDFRLDQESKAYHRSDEKRSALLNTAKQGHHLSSLIENLEAQDAENDKKVRRGIDKIHEAKRKRLNRELARPIRRPSVVRNEAKARPRSVAVKPFNRTNPIPSIERGNESGGRGPSPSRIPVPVPAARGKRIDLRRLALMTNAKIFTIDEER